jgi:putative ABC transport system permease protein
MNLPIAKGKAFNELHMRDGRPVAIIGQGVRSRFFTTEDPIGRTIKVGDTWLTVVGVLADRKVSSAIAQRLGIRDANMDVYVPASTMLVRFRNRSVVTQEEIEAASSLQTQQRRIEVAASGGEAPAEETPEERLERRNMNQVDRILIRVSDSRFMAPVAEVARRLLGRRHNGVVDFEIMVPELLLQQEQRTRTIFNIVLGAIASISLIVGGIGIMNIMLASVLERTREIGVRRAVGATRRDVLAQFLIEAVLISVTGGILGILIGGGISVGIERAAGIKTIISVFSVMLAFVVSLSVGLAFGILPAYRAAQRDPVDCLRYE